MPTRCHLKLTKANYATWRTQFCNLLFGYDLLGFIDGSNPCPSEKISSPNSQNLTPNPFLKLRMRQDSFIEQAIVGSVSPNFTSLVTASLNWHDAWLKLERTYANESQTRMLSLRESLLKIKKDSLSIDD